MGRDKFATKIDEITQELNFLKVDGREINTIMNTEAKSKKNRIIPPAKFLMQESHPYSDLQK